jgi:hypothetical protein
MQAFARLLTIGVRGCAALFALLAIVAARGPAAADYRYHVVWQYTNNFYNSFAYFRNGFLFDVYASAGGFTTFEQWRDDAYNDNAWTETGLVSGDVNGLDWNGVFGAYNQPTSGYVEFTIGPNSPSDYAIESILSVESGNSCWVDYIYDGAVYDEVETTSPYGNRHQVGLESDRASSADFNFFQSGIELELLAAVRWRELMVSLATNWHWIPERGLK